MGDDTYAFRGENLGSDVVDEIYGGAEDTSQDVLDFAHFPDPVSIDLTSTEPQLLSPNLTITLTDGLGIEVVIGSPSVDEIQGNERSAAEVRIG